MSKIIGPPCLNWTENQYVDVDAAQGMPRQCGDLETIWAAKASPGGLELSGGYAILGRAAADFISFQAQTFSVETATNG